MSHQTHQNLTKAYEGTKPPKVCPFCGNAHGYLKEMRD